MSVCSTAELFHNGLSLSAVTEQPNELQPYFRLFRKLYVILRARTARPGTLGYPRLQSLVTLCYYNCTFVEGRAVLCNNGSMLMCHSSDLKMLGCVALLFSWYFPTFQSIPVVTFTLEEKDSSTLKLGTVTSSKLLYLSNYTASYARRR
jgi:hypothetical protein